MKRYFLIPIAVILIFFLVIFIEVMLARKGQQEDFKNPSNEPLIVGQGDGDLTYIIIGDSTSAGQGGTYEKGIAVSSAKYLSEKTSKRVKLINFSISGATVEDIANSQLSKALEYKPDFILIAAGGNDVTHLNSLNNVRDNIQAITDKLIEKNCDVKIILTGSPDMGSVPRLAQPLRQIVGLRAKSLNNKVFYPFIEKNKFTLAPIARETGPIFRKDKTLFAADEYHPNDRGYEIWNGVISKAFDEALKNQITHCN